VETAHRTPPFSLIVVLTVSRAGQTLFFFFWNWRASASFAEASSIRRPRGHDATGGDAFRPRHGPLPFADSLVALDWVPSQSRVRGTRTTNSLTLTVNRSAQAGSGEVSVGSCCGWSAVAAALMRAGLGIQIGACGG